MHLRSFYSSVSSLLAENKTFCHTLTIVWNDAVCDATNVE